MKKEKNIKLDAEEKEILEAFESGKLEQSEDAKGVQEKHTEHAKVVF